MKLAFLERNSIGLDIDVSAIKALADEYVEYANTVGAEETTAHVGDADILVLNKAKINEETIGNCPNVKYITLLATGFDNIDLEYCKSRGIKVSNVTNYCCPAVAQHTILLALMLSEKIAYYDQYVKSGAYGAQDRFSHFDRSFYEMEGKTWGIVGMGNIGRKVAQMATGMGCKVIFYSASGKSTCTDYPMVDLDTLLAESDILSLHCPLSDRTQNLINMDALKKMKKTAILVNVARGPVVNSQDLYTALEEEIIAGAGLDVLEKEPIAADDPLGRIKDSTKLIITPHMSWTSIESRQRLLHENVTNIESFLAGGNKNVLNL